MIRKIGNNFFDKKGNKLNKRENKEFFIKLKRNQPIPPSYTEVEFYPDDNKLWAKGRDGNNKIQYFYTPEFIEKQKIKKFCDLIEIGKNFNQLLKRLNKDAQTGRTTLSRTARAILLMLECGFRIGGTNGSIGTSQIQWKHVRANHIEFNGKAQALNSCDVKSDVLVRHLHNRSKTDVPIFKDVRPSHINQYLKDIAKSTSMGLRRWSVNMAFLQRAANITRIQKSKLTDKQIKQILKETAEHHNHTVTTCKNHYLFPPILDYVRKYPLNDSVNTLRNLIRNNC